MTIVLTNRDDLYSPLLHQLLGLDEIAAGKVLLFGQPFPFPGIAGSCALRSRVGLLFARGGLISNLKVLENLLLPVQYHRQSLPRPRPRPPWRCWSGSAITARRWPCPGCSAVLNENRWSWRGRSLRPGPDDLRSHSSMDSTIASGAGFWPRARRFMARDPDGRHSFSPPMPALAALLPDAKRVNLAKGVSE